MALTAKELNRMLAQSIDKVGLQRTRIDALEIEIDHLQRELNEERKENAALKRAAPIVTPPTAAELSKVFTEAFEIAFPKGDK